MTVNELYLKFDEKIPSALSEPWDNDGIMCCADGSQEVSRVLVTLDVTDEIVDYAVSSHFDLIISHHPLIFRPLSSVTEESHVARKVIKLLSEGVSVFSFHTRADKVSGGVNDQLAELIGVHEAVPFGEGFLGRIGTVDEECELEEFVCMVKQSINADAVRYADAFNSVKRVAVVGGDGKDFVKAAIEAGADTYVSGRIGYNLMEEASGLGINLVEAGHFFTEQPVTEFFRDLVSDFDSDIYVETVDSNAIKVL